MSGRVLDAGIIKTNETQSLSLRAFQPKGIARGRQRASEGAMFGENPVQ